MSFSHPDIRCPGGLGDLPMIVWLCSVSCRDCGTGENQRETLPPASAALSASLAVPPALGAARKRGWQEKQQLLARLASGATPLMAV